jgi:hypothetical protein
MYGLKKCANPRCENKEDPRWGGFCDGCAPDPQITQVIRTAAYERGRLAGIEEGRAAERADVVAWLHGERRCGVSTRSLIKDGAHVGAAGKVVKP